MRDCIRLSIVNLYLITSEKSLKRKMKKLITILYLTASTSAFAEDFLIYPVDELANLSNSIGTERIIVSKIEKALTTVPNLREAQAIEDITGQFEERLAELVLFGRLYNNMKHSEDMKSIEGLIYTRRLVYQDKCEELPPLLELPISRLNRRDLIEASQRIKVKIAQSCEYVAKWKRPGS